MMKMKKIVVALLPLLLVLVLFEPVKAAPPSVVQRGSEFIISYFVKHDEERARTYLASNVAIPELRENTQINGVMGLPSPQENVSVAVTYFDDGRGRSGRIAFIWELIFENDKITDIRVVFDGANPYTNESNLMNEFESKSKTNLLAPYEYPFEMTHIEGEVNENSLELNYRNDEMEASMQIRVEKNNTTIETFQENGDRFYMLRNGIKALYKPNSQLIFQSNSLHYSIRINRNNEEGQTFQADDFLKVANSMQYR